MKILKLKRHDVRKKKKKHVEIKEKIFRERGAC